ncbi:unnamed protein product [Mytilus coruscus]|uniref:Uncharacterized protein n=1 Tax=Mytilus coruscus TaxID=42192 RepID=A0A6J8C728_MYTCO|nr:unnamed protein product [Mytilus coruscus]
MHTEIVKLRQVLKQNMSTVTSGLQEEDKKVSEITTRKRRLKTFGHNGQETLAQSSAYNPILVQDSAVPNKLPFWSNSFPSPGVQHNVGSTVPAAAVFYPGPNKENSNIPSIPTNSEITPDRHKGRYRKRCQRESSSSSEDSLDRESSHLKESHARGRSKSPQPPKVPVFTGSGNISLEDFI